MDREELRELYEEYAKDVYTYILRLSRSEDKAFDLMQDVFLRVHKYKRPQQELTNPRGWLLKIAHNLYLNETRKWQRTETLSIDELSNPPSEADKTDEILLRMVKHQIIQRLQQLDEVYAHVFILRVDFEMTQNEIAETIGSSKSSIRRHLECIRNIIVREFSDAFEHFFLNTK